MKYKILIVEDDVILAQSVRLLCEERLTCSVEIALNLAQGESCLGSDDRFDLLILDRILPDGEGLQLLKDFKDELSLTKVLVLSDLSRAQEREWGLNMGASDYLSKPFTKGELLARAHNLLLMRKAQVEEKDYQLQNEFVFRPAERKLFYDQQIVTLTKSDTDLLEYFFCHRNFLVTMAEIENCLWKTSETELKRAAISAQIYRLRKKMGRFANSLQTFYSSGYQLVITKT